MKKKAPVRRDDDDSDDSDDDMPLGKRAASKPVKKEESDSDSDDDTPLVGSDYRHKGAFAISLADEVGLVSPNILITHYLFVY